jgi:peptidoglycan hydrolase CwlO-like protein
MTLNKEITVTTFWATYGGALLLFIGGLVNLSVGQARADQRIQALEAKVVEAEHYAKSLDFKIEEINNKLNTVTTNTAITANNQTNTMELLKELRDEIKSMKR